jgi:hypothetical protein
MLARVGERLELPGGVVGAADIPDLACTCEAVKCVERFLDSAPFMDLIYINMIGAESFEACNAGVEKVIAGETRIDRALTGRKSHFR